MIETVSEAFHTLANIAGGTIRNNKFELVSTTSITKTRVKHDPQDFYCLSVPGKAFYIRSDGKMSVTGNSVHVEGMTWLFKEFLKEHRDIWTDELKSQLYSIAEKMVELEDKFIDLAFAGNDFEGLTSDEVKTYIRYITDRRLIGLGMKGIFKVKKNPLPWVEELLGAPEHQNFFEGKATAYAKGALTGSWSKVWK